MFCFWAEYDLFNNVTVIPSLSEDSIEVTLGESQFCGTCILIKVFSWMNQKSKNNLLLSIKDFSPHIHTSVVMAKLRPQKYGFG